jgi:hypothetical protein
MQSYAPPGCTAFAVARQICHAKQSSAKQSKDYCCIADVGYATTGDTGKTAVTSPTSTGTTGHTYSQTAATSPVGGTRSGPAISNYPTGPGTDQSKTSSQVHNLPLKDIALFFVAAAKRACNLFSFSCLLVNVRRHGSADQPKRFLDLQVTIMLNLQSTSQP